MASLPASSVALRCSLPSSESLSQSLTVLEEPSAGVNVSATLQVEETPSFQDATVSSPIFNSLSERVMAGPAMTFTDSLDTVMTGAWVSFAGVGSTGVTGVGGVGSTGSGPRQEKAKAQASSVAARFFAMLRLIRLNQRIFITNALDGMPCGNAPSGVKVPAPLRRDDTSVCLSSDGSQTDLPEYPYPA